MSKFPCSLTRNMTSHSMENLTFHSLLRWKVIILQILTTSLIQSLLKGWENTLFELRIERVKNPPLPSWQNVVVVRQYVLLFWSIVSGFCTPSKYECDSTSLMVGVLVTLSNTKDGILYPLHTLSYTWIKGRASLYPHPQAKTLRLIFDCLQGNIEVRTWMDMSCGLKMTAEWVDRPKTSLTKKGKQENSRLSSRLPPGDWLVCCCWDCWLVSCFFEVFLQNRILPKLQWGGQRSLQPHQQSVQSCGCWKSHRCLFH